MFTQMSNPWLYLLAASVPAIFVFGRTNSRSSNGRLLLANAMGYLFLNAAVDWAWDERSAAALLNGLTGDALVAATADGANRVFVLTLGWVPVALYAMVCRRGIDALGEGRSSEPAEVTRRA